jgi:NADH-quinone oxidoreductase subunit F
VAEHIILRHREVDNLASLKVYGKYEALKKALGMSRDDVINEVKNSGLRGRGGAGFPTGVKWSFVPKVEGDKYICVNADESEPGTFKDREIMEGNPHQMIEGALIAAHAIGATAVYIYTRGEFWDLTHAMDKAIDAARKAGYIGKNIHGSGWDCEVFTHLGAGAYICGEETALLESLEGKRGYPRIRPPFPAVAGLYAKPTVINNVETLANVPFIINNGADAYKAIGTPDSAGVKVYSLSGHVKNPGNYELPFGGTTTMRYLVEELGGGTPSGLAIKGILPAGASAAILPATDDVLDLPITYDAYKPWNTAIGSASVIVLDESVDMVWAASKMVRFFNHESCGQCTPCREGTYWLRRLYERAEEGLMDAADMERMNSVAAQMKGKCICALGEFAVNPVMATIKWYPEDYQRNFSPVMMPEPGITTVPYHSEDLKEHLTIRRNGGHH